MTTRRYRPSSASTSTDNLSFNLIGRYTDAVLHYSDDDPTTFPGVTFPTQSVYRNRNFYGRGEAVWTLLDGRFVNTFGVNYTNYVRSNKDPDPNPQTNFNRRAKNTNGAAPSP